ncbi:MAG: choice-of-anchor B family protein [Planctomycetes bacterium]|nr:choice-of-anchor B family protein [Planctomycetota bacterium]
MRNSLPACVLGALILGSLTAPLVAHEDDPKILDRVAPITGQGFRRSVPQNALAGALGGGQVFQGSTFDSNGVQLLSWIPLNQIDSSQSANDCWGYVSPTGREIAIIGTYSGTAFFDLTDPGNPLQIGYINGPDSLWRDIKIYDHYAYAVNEDGGGIQIIDLDNVDSGQVSLVGTVNGAGDDATHNIVIDEDSGFLYRTGGGNNGLRMYDLNANPAAPVFVGQWNTKYVHDAQIVTYTSGPYAGKQVAFCCAGFNGGYGNTGLTIVDVTNKSNPVIMGEAFYSNPAYSHQGWLSEDRNYFYLGDELDEDGSLPTTTHIINVSNLNNPVTQGSFTNGNQAIGHNLYTHNGLIFAANYTSGLRIFDYAANPLNPQEVAYFDTRPSDDGDTFNGMWSVYPYFPSGVVVCSDLERGMFVLYAGDPQLDVAVVGGVPSLIDPNGINLDVTITEATPGLLAPGSAALIYDAGAGAISIPLTHVSGDQYTVDFPALACGSSVDWYISADSTSGLNWSAPAAAPSSTYSSLVGFGSADLAVYDMESTGGWTSGAAGDDATTGIWTRGNPNASDAQPGDDHTAAGTDCWFTGQANNGDSVGTNDVDGGTTTLLSPVFMLAANPDARIEYWRWYVNNGNNAVDDSMFVDITSNGSNWVNVETLAPGNLQAAGGWYQHSFAVADYVTPSNQVRLRFRVGDLGSGSIVEAAIDDLRITETDCSGGTMTIYCSPNVSNSTGLPALISGQGSTTASDNNLTLVADQLPSGKLAYFLAATGQGLIASPPGSMGNLCLGGSLARLNAPSQVRFTGASGSISLQLDLTNMPTNPAQPVLAGQTWNFQCWYRDTVLVSTSNFTDGLSVQFQ